MSKFFRIRPAVATAALLGGYYGVKGFNRDHWRVFYFKFPNSNVKEPAAKLNIPPHLNLIEASTSSRPPTSSRPIYG